MTAIDKAITRFNEKIEIMPSGCWRWRGTLSKFGYAQHYIGSRVVPGHLFAYEFILGKQRGKREMLKHTCEDRACVNPNHLAPFTRSLADRFWEKVKKSDGCWNWTAYAMLGYGKISLGGRSGPVLATHASWFLHHGVWPPRKSHLCHTCDNPACVRPDHLYIGNAATNCADRENRGRGNQPLNEGNGKCKWPSALVRTIRDLRGKMTAKQISEKYGVPLVTVYGYWHVNRRKHV